MPWEWQGSWEGVRGHQRGHRSIHTTQRLGGAPPTPSRHCGGTGPTYMGPGGGNPAGQTTLLGTLQLSPPFTLCTPHLCSGVAAGATLGGHWHSVIKTSVSLMKSYPLLGRGETQIIMNQFSSGQPSARASRGGSQTATGRGRRTLPSQYSLGAGQAARRGRLGLSLWWGRWAEGSLWSGTPSHRLPGMDARGAPASTRQAMEKRRPSSAPPEICPRPRTAPAPLPPLPTPGSWSGVGDGCCAARWGHGHGSVGIEAGPPRPPRASAAGRSCGPWSRSPPPAARRARRLSRAPRGLRQAGNLLLFVECFCHANPRTRRWRYALRRWGVFAFFFPFPWPLPSQLLVLFTQARTKST